MTETNSLQQNLVRIWLFVRLLNINDVRLNRLCYTGKDIITTLVALFTNLLAFTIPYAVYAFELEFPRSFRTEVFHDFA